MSNRDSAVFPNDENGDVLWHMHCDGDNLSIAREMDFQVVFYQERQAELFREFMASSGFRAQVSHYPEQQDGRVWDVQVRITMVPTHAAICAFEERLQEDASMGGGQNDGWGSFKQS